MSITKTHLGLTINSIYRDSISTIWNTMINDLRRIPGMIVNDAVLHTLNSWPITGSNWPSFGNRYSNIPGLLNYKGNPITLRMNLSDGWQYCTIGFQPCRIERMSEIQRWHSRSYIGVLAPNLPVFGVSELYAAELPGIKLTKEEAIASFSVIKSRTHSSNVAWYVSTTTLEALIEQLDSKVALIELSKKQQVHSKQEARIYSRYLKNRWPQVEAFLKINPVNRA